MRTILILLGIAILLGGQVRLAIAADSPEDLARKAALDLLKAVKAKDLDATLKLTAAPFVHREDNKPVVLKDEAAVKAWIKGRLDDLKDANRVPTELGEVTPIADVLEKIQDE